MNIICKFIKISILFLPDVVANWVSIMKLYWDKQQLSKLRGVTKSISVLLSCKCKCVVLCPEGCWEINFCSIYLPNILLPTCFVSCLTFRQKTKLFMLMEISCSQFSFTLLPYSSNHPHTHHRFSASKRVEISAHIHHLCVFHFEGRLSKHE